MRPSVWSLLNAMGFYLWPTKNCSFGKGPTFCLVPSWNLGRCRRRTVGAQRFAGGIAVAFGASFSVPSGHCSVGGPQRRVQLKAMITRGAMMDFQKFHFRAEETWYSCTPSDMRGDRCDWLCLILWMGDMTQYLLLVSITWTFSLTCYDDDRPIGGIVLGGMLGNFSRLALSCFEVQVEQDDEERGAAQRHSTFTQRRVTCKFMWADDQLRGGGAKFRYGLWLFLIAGHARLYRQRRGPPSVRG